jgi:putative ABC transport system permease protein
MNLFVHEIRHAARDLFARPAWSLLVVAVLAAGLGTVLYVLAILNGMLLRPLPFAQPQQLHIAGLLTEGNDPDELDSVPQRDADELALRLEGKALVAGWSDGTVNLVDGQRAERHDGSFVSPNLFAVLGVAPILGSGFDAGDAAPGAPLRVVLGYDVWQTRYLGDPSIIGRAVRVNGEAATVAAVMPPRFSFPRISTLWVAARASDTVQRSDDRPMQMVLRIAQPQDLPAVQAVLDAWHQTVHKEEPNWSRSARAGTIGIGDYFIDVQTRNIMGVMFAATLLVLLVACGNAANLMLARHLGRQQELAVRVALGASRARIVLQLLSHSVLLSLVAAVVALAGAHLAVSWTIDAFTAAAGDGGPPAWMRFDLDLRMVVAAVIAAIATGLLSGLWPALKLSAGVSGALRDGGRGMVGGAFARVGGVLVMVEIALSAALLIGALAMVQMVTALDRFELGVRTERLLTARIGLFDSQYPTAEARQQLFERLVERLRAESEVEAVTVSTALPGIMGGNEQLLPEAAAATDEAQWVGVATVDAYFAATYGTRLLAGRWIDSRDRAGGEPVAMVDRKFVERYAGERDPLGMRFRLSPHDPTSRVVTVIGVTEPLTLEDADDDPEAVLLVPQAQNPPSFASIALRTRGDPAAFKQRLVAVMREIDADTPLYWVRTYGEVLAVANFGQRLLSTIYAAFGLIALLLAAGGLYGVVGFTVAQRTREIGVRRALGASPGMVMTTILRRSAWQVGIGLGAGLALGVPFALLLSASMDGQLQIDPRIWLLVATVLGSVALLASLIPARRALRVDPMVALRHD